MRWPSPLGTSATMRAAQQHSAQQSLQMDQVATAVNE
jgi:hypothetical protein